ncbi:MAG: GDSL-type esterase/lipase family protein [Xenococcaceae cyanobacterium]
MQTIFPVNPTSVNQSRHEKYRLKVGQPLKIVALGDSLVYGFGDFVGGGWVERLRRQWMSPASSGHVLYNLGIRGDRTNQVYQRLEQEFRCRGELRNRLPDLILLSVGVNDSPCLMRKEGKPFTDFVEFQEQINNLLDLAQSFCPVMFIGMVPVAEGKMPFLDCLYYSHLNQYRYKEVTKRACQNRQIPYLDIFDLWLARGEDWIDGQLSADGLHPNVQGYQTLLQDILKWQPIVQIS